MDDRDAVGDFLVSRRARLSPSDAGLPAGGDRRVPGLRRSEVASLAGISVEYYARMERGRLGGVSDTVLDALASALRLDPAERDHLRALARSWSPAAAVGRDAATAGEVGPALRFALDSIAAAPAIVRNAHLDIVAANALGRALYDEAIDGPARGSIARYTFLDPRARAFSPDWSDAADVVVGILRSAAGAAPYAPSMRSLVSELHGSSGEFRSRWDAHRVRRHGTGRKTFVHHRVGVLELAYEQLDVASDPGSSMLVYAPVPGTGTVERLPGLLSSDERAGSTDDPPRKG